MADKWTEFGEPKDGAVEISYEVASAHRSKGLATERAAALMKQAYKHKEVSNVQVHTPAEEEESGSVLKKCGMKTGRID